MAKISKAEHARILDLVDVQGTKVAAVADAYGCTAANIYALLGKLRRAAAPEAAGSATGKARKTADPEVVRPKSAIVVSEEGAADLFAAPANPPATASPAADSVGIKPAEHRKNALPTDPPANERTEGAHPTVAVSATITDLSDRRQRAERPRGVGAKLAKPGFGLVLRTPEGDESVTPFRSLDDLLSAVKPILRTAARSPDLIWFSIQAVDLATISDDAA